MKIGILGGTFDPIHRMHLQMAASARAQYGLDEVWLMPSGDPPHKEAGQITPGVHRLRMVELAVTGQEGLLASDYELCREGKIYTADTLTDLAERYPDVEWYFILGGDSLAYIERWYHPERIFQHATILAVVRDSSATHHKLYGEIGAGNDLESKREALFQQYPEARIDFVQMEMDTISSSQIRAWLTDSQQSGENESLIQASMPKAVYDYIQREGLYQS